MADSNFPQPPDKVQDYITNRVEQYAGWYDKKSSALKNQFLRVRAVTVVGGALVPVLVNMGWTYASVAATIVSLLVVILVSWDSVFQYGKQWRNYRSTEQFLRQELIYFQNRVSFYAKLDDEEAFKTLVERVETAIAQENAVTLDTLTRDLEKSKGTSS
jgi:hypothetical protein